MKKRIILAGTGAMGMCWVDRLKASADWDVAAFVDGNAHNLKIAGERYGLPKKLCFATLEDALNAVKADALLDVTPQQARRGLCTMAMQHGLDVLCEKPLADTLRNAAALVKVAAKTKRALMVAQNYRYQPVFDTVRRLLASGAIGQLGYLGVGFHKGPHFGGYREAMPYPLVLDMSIHHFDLIRCLTGADVVAVQAKSVGAPWNWNKGDATILAQLELSNGTAANYFGSWVTTGYETSWNADWRFDGSEGSLEIVQDAVFLGKAANKRKKIPVPKPGLQHQAWLLDAFVRALDTGVEPETSGRNNLNSLAATHAVVRAAKEQRRVTVSELLT